MICPSCKREIADGSIICPICNTQFAFTIPGQTQTSNSNLYEVVENNAPKVETLEESAYSPVENVLPTEVSHYPEEEINPDENALKYASTTQDNQEEYMHIHGQAIEQEPYNPAGVSVSPIRPEAPISTPNEPVIPPSSVNTVNTPQTINPTVQVPLSNVAPINQNVPIQPQVVVTNGVVSQPAVQNKQNKKIKKEDLFFGGVSVVGTIILVFMVFSLFNNKNTPSETVSYHRKGNVYEQTIQETDNVGLRSTFNSPLKIGDTTLASIFDTLNQAYVDVDVTGVRFIEGVEAEELAKNYAKEPLIEGFTWFGFEYRVKFNDLKTLTGVGIEPVLNSKIYRWNGCDFVTYNEKNYSLKTYNVYTGGTIANTQSATVKVVYQIPASETTYSVCFGYLEKTMGCFAKNFE